MWHASLFSSPQVSSLPERWFRKRHARLPSVPFAWVSCLPSSSTWHMLIRGALLDLSLPRVVPPSAPYGAPHLLLCSRPHIFCCAPACGLQYSPVFSHLHPLPECELFQGRGCALLSCLRCLAGCSARRTMPVLWEGTSGSTVWSCCGWRVASLLTQSSGEWESRFAVWGLTAVARHPVIAASCSPGAWLQLCSLHQVRLVQVEPQHLSTCYVPGAGLNAFRVAHWILTATLRSVLL